MDSNMTPLDALKNAIDCVGSQAGFARLCNVGQPAVSKWLNAAKRLPPEHVLAVERETGISKHLLRPDVFGASPADLAVLSAASNHAECNTQPVPQPGTPV